MHDNHKGREEEELTGKNESRYTIGKEMGIK